MFNFIFDYNQYLQCLLCVVLKLLLLFMMSLIETYYLGLKDL